MLWLKYLQMDPGAFNDFEKYLQEEKAKAVQMVISAVSWEDTLRFRGDLSRINLMIGHVEQFKEQERTNVGTRNGQ